MDTPTPTVLVIDDSPTIRKMVECHLSQAGYRVEAAPDADRGIEAARSIRPDLILLDHQLPGTTGDEVCRRLLADECTAQVPVVVSSALRNRAFASYTDFPNVVDQIPKPFTPEMLKSGVANALQTGPMIVRAQRNGSAVPETVGEVQDAALEGDGKVFPVRAILNFLNNASLSGRLTVEVDRHRLRFGVAEGRIQAVHSPTVPPEEVAALLPEGLRDLSPLLVATMGEQLDPSMKGLVRMLEQTLSAPQRLKSLLRSQAAILCHLALTSEAGRFSFEPHATLPPMFQAFPMQASLAYLAVEGTRLRDPSDELDSIASVIFGRCAARGANLDRSGLSAMQIQLSAAFDGVLTLDMVAAKGRVPLDEAADIARGLELAGILERRAPRLGGSVLAVVDDADEARVVQSTLGSSGEGCTIRVVRDRVGAQLLLRRESFDLILLDADRADIDEVLKDVRMRCGKARLLGLVGLDGEEALARIDQLGLDGVAHRPIVASDLVDTVKHLILDLVPAG
jgi:CheY-like chemotaxis protein